jgi:hypothetical protein
MAYPKRNSDGPDRRLSSLDYQIQNWAKRYGVSEERLREAVKNAGPPKGDFAAPAGKLH